MERISKHQLVAMIILFEIGSAALFEIGISAKQDAWLVMLIGMIPGFLLFMLFLAIQRLEPDKDLIQMLIQYFGSFFGRLIAFSYVCNFMYESMRNVRDFGDLTLMTFLSKTPISVVMLVMMLLASYVLFKGVEVFFRVAEFMLLGVLFFYLLLIILYFSSGIVHIDRLFPILENGIIPVLKGAFPDPILFPFGQLVLFLMYWNYLNDKDDIVKISIRAYVFVGIFLTILSILNIAILGVPYVSVSNLPLLASVRLIQIADFLERFDAFVVLLLYVGIFIKVTLWYLAAVLGLGRLLNTNYRKLILPVGGIIYGTSHLPPSWTYHIWLGKFLGLKYLQAPFFIVFIPTLLFLFMFVKKKPDQAK
ncbi:GerAB/ArcD/ProY family transporter [Ectobacillus funiculus]|uniref:GerAB/ArcD/ProY family transporter n=1 Tax=Ectobacillus funiculus TaxID=137993 RepID=UPI00101BF9C8|nr:GerAB/ArcD/ProY family transporter [Ectobacillus funiculus]